MPQGTPPRPAGNALAALYTRHFQVVPVRTPALLDKVFRLRYQVYCLENSFEHPPKELGRREIDRYDAHSVHSALIHKDSGEVVGTVRLILPTADGGIGDLPVRSLVAAETREHLGRFPPMRTAEISRYAVSKLFRQRQGEHRYADVGADFDQRLNERRIMPYVTLGLMRGVIEMALENGIEHLIAVMEPTLIRLLLRFGLRFDTIGPLIDYHGVRQPAVITPQRMIESLGRQSLDYWRFDAPDRLDSGAAHRLAS